MTLLETPESTAALPSLAVANDEEKAALRAATAIERDWYAEHSRFETNEDIGRAAGSGVLALVEPTIDMVPVARFRNPALRLAYPPYLLPNSKEAYHAFGRLWRVQLADAGVEDPRLRLASTSFTRSEMTQATIVSDPTKLAEPESTHCAGGPWDTDASDYYWLGDDGQYHKVTRGDRDYRVVQEIADRLGDTPTPVAPIEHNEKVIIAAMTVADRLHHAGLVNRILEFAGSSNQCLHIAPNPEVEAEEWQALASGQLEL